MMARRINNAAEQINNYEKKWKIKTNINKFKVLPIADKKTGRIHIGGEDIVPAWEGKALGLKLKRDGFSSHARERAQHASGASIKLKRFSGMTTKTKIRLYKTLIRPILEYPSVPLHLASRNQKRKIQRVQNQMLRWATGDRHTPIEVLHDVHKMEPMNKRLEKQARKVWTKIQAFQEDVYEELNTVHFRRHHPWWPRSILKLEEDEADLIKLY